MSNKETINVKSNGLRNELKEIHKSIDKLTNALIEIHIAQTTQHENNNDYCTCGNSRKLRKSKQNDD